MRFPGSHLIETDEQGRRYLTTGCAALWGTTPRSNVAQSFAETFLTIESIRYFSLGIRAWGTRRFALFEDSGLSHSVL